MNLFKDKDEIKNLVKRADNSTETKRLTKMFQQLKKERADFYLTQNELEEILKWKLRSQYGRQKEQRKINTPKNIIAITQAAFAVTHKDKDVETTLKLKLLSTLTGVEIPVASAILTLCYPNKYSVIDFRNWRQVYKSDKTKTTYTTAEYTKYLNAIQEQAKKYGVTPQEIDIAIWQKDIETNGTKTL